MGDTNMKIMYKQYFALKIYLHRKFRPIVITGLTQDEVDDFNANASSKMFVRYGPIFFRSENIDYIIVVRQKEKNS